MKERSSVQINDLITTERRMDMDKWMEAERKRFVINKPFVS